MAKLTDSQMKYRLNRSLIKDKDLKNKIEKQKEKELFGQEWWTELKEKKITEKKKKIENQNQEDKVVEENIFSQENFGDLAIYDSIDLENFFDFPKLIKENGKSVKFSYEKVKDSLDMINKAINKIDQNFYSDELEQELEENSQNSEQYNLNIKKIQEIRENFYKEAYSNYQEFVPIYNKYVCNCCGQELSIDNYYINFNITNLSKIDKYGNIRMSVCKKCVKKTFDYIYINKTKKDAKKAIKIFCSYFNLYYDNDLFIQAVKNSQENNNKNHIIEEYIKILNINPLSIGKNFIESPEIIGDVVFNKKNNIQELSEEEQKKLSIDDINFLETLDWSPDDLKNRKTVIKMVGYDVFDYETEENRKQLYNDLLGMVEPGMEQDSVKMQAAIQIATSFLKIREMNKQYRKLQTENAPLSDLKTLADLKQKEMMAITKFSQDNGFSERFSTAKEKGENTFTGILNKMNEDKFENAILNRYDIETSETIQQAANASFEAIFKQLSYSDSDAYTTVAEQLKELLKLRKEKATLEEELRLANYKLAKINLEEKAKKAGVTVDD